MFLRYRSALMALVVVATFSFGGVSSAQISQSPSGVVTVDSLGFNTTLSIIGTATPGEIRVIFSTGNSVVVADVTGLVVNMGAGDNRLNILYVTINGNLEYSGGIGRDRIDSNDHATINGSLYCDMRGGDDLLYLEELTIGGDVDLDMGDGENQSWFNDCNIGGDFLCTGGDDGDLVSISSFGSTLVESVVHGDISVATGHGTGVVFMGYSVFEGNINVDGGRDYDLARFVEAMVLGRTTIRTNRDEDNIDFDESVFLQRVSCHAGQQDDDIDVRNCSFPTSKTAGLYVDGSHGADSLSKTGTFSGSRLFQSVENISGF